MAGTIPNPVEREAEHEAAFGPRAGATMPLLEERAEVSTVRVDRGGVRVSKRVESREESVSVPLNQTDYQVERRALNRTLEGQVAPEPRYEGSTFVIPVVEEVLVTEKRLVLVEEIRITRTDTARTAERLVTLRREVVDVLELAPDDASSPSRSSSESLATERDPLVGSTAPRGHLSEGNTP